MPAYTPTYDRSPSQRLQDLLSPGGFLAPLIELQECGLSGHFHDVHFRANDEVHVYRGLTRLITVRKTLSNEVRMTAHPTYQTQACAQGLLRLWHIDELGLSEELLHYLSNVEVAPSFVGSEGRVQEQWSQVTRPWTPFDREGVLGGVHQMGREFPQVQVASKRLYELSRSNGWASPNSTGAEVDQLAVDPEGRLVLLELKDASKRNAEIYYAPFQLLHYVWEWHSALEAVGNGLQAVIDSRVAVGLTHYDVPPLAVRLRAAVGFGPDQRSREVKKRYGTVLEVVNQHLPAEVGPIETWAFTDTGPDLVP